MNADLIQQYEYLWNGTDPNWVLLKASELEGGYCVFNKLGSILIIENDAVKEAVCKRMKDARCEILENIPKGSTVAVAKPAPPPEPTRGAARSGS
jgi:hypothetical protein